MIRSFSTRSRSNWCPFAPNFFCGEGSLPEWTSEKRLVPFFYPPKSGGPSQHGIRAPFGPYSNTAETGHVDPSLEFLGPLIKRSMNLPGLSLKVASLLQLGGVRDPHCCDTRPLLFSRWGGHFPSQREAPSHSGGFDFGGAPLDPPTEEFIRSEFHMPFSGEAGPTVFFPENCPRRGGWLEGWQENGRGSSSISPPLAAAFFPDACFSSMIGFAFLVVSGRGEYLRRGFVCRRISANSASFPPLTCRPAALVPTYLALRNGSRFGRRHCQLFQVHKVRISLEHTWWFKLLFWKSHWKACSLATKTNKAEFKSKWLSPFP